MIFAFGVVENNLFGCVMMKAKPLRNYIKKKKKKKKTKGPWRIRARCRDNFLFTTTVTSFLGCRDSPGLQSSVLLSCGIAFLGCRDSPGLQSSVLLSCGIAFFGCF
jgi:hypothetical protein